METADPTSSPGRWDGLHEIIRHIEHEIEALYAERGATGVRSRFAYLLIRLHHTGPLTVGELAVSLDRSQPAISQTVAAMRREGLVESHPGSDSRTRTISLTDRGRSLVTMLEAEWRATGATIAELDDEISGALSSAVVELQRVLAARPVRDRLAMWMRYFEVEHTTGAAAAGDATGPS